MDSVKCYFEEMMDNKIMWISSRDPSRTQQQIVKSSTQEKKGALF